ncbi:FGGY-family carbohydrate kinase [Levilactobacillus zymae]|uniref:FGGY-family carbohydrate kinase n=1 Tax=Levilactobacillus zymae TaxID=267363 RepID=UPI0028B39B63|nr:FGGY-family carbohydrate kinase [Levilactobacillus zymae]MDT6981323.1 FGGY-family carbohydrate kinase [Levilactobacillus zymae]
MKYLIGTDIGTSGTKSILMDTAGHLIAQDLEEYDVLTPKPLWAEQWPSVWVDGLKKSIQKTVEKAGVDPHDIKGVGISGLYGGSGIPVDEHMQPVRPCLIWMDRRAEDEVAWVKEHIDGDRLTEITGNDVVDPYYGYTKILWIKNHEPENWKKTRMFLPPSNYAIYELTGKVAIDHTAAGNLGGFYDVNTNTWSKEMLDAMGVPESMMPMPIVDSTTIVGGLTAAAAKELGLLAGTPVISGGVDVGAANVGMGVFKPGKYVAAIGQSMNAALVSEKPIKGQGLIVWPYPYKSENLVYNFSGSATAGAITKWFRDTFAQEEVAAQKAGGDNAYVALNKEAKKLNIGPGSEGLVVLPYFMGERAPIWNSDAKGLIFGLSLVHTKAHIYHAFQEAVCYALRHSIESTGRDLGDYIIIAGGVTNSKDWVQMFADVTGYAVRTPIEDAEANLGDVMLAGIGTGILDVDDVQKWQVLGDPVEPNAKRHAVYNQYYTMYRKLYQDLVGDMHGLTKLAKLDANVASDKAPVSAK